MIETRRLENVVIFLQRILSFVLSRKIKQSLSGLLITNKSFHYLVRAAKSC